MRSALLALALLATACGTKTTTDVVDTDDTEVSDTDATTDCTEATAPIGLSLADDAFFTASETLSWSAPDGCADTERYEVALGTTAGGDEVSTWTSAGTATSYQFDELTLATDTDYFLSVRTVDVDGHTSEAATSAAFQVWTPAELTGVRVWLDAESGVYSDDACTTAAVADDMVMCWKDRSENGNDAKGSVINVLPVAVPIGDPVNNGALLRTDAMNGKPGLFFDGRTMEIAGNQSLDLGATFLVSAATTWDGEPDGRFGRPPTEHYIVNRESSYEVGMRFSRPAAAVETASANQWAWGQGSFAYPTGPHVFLFAHLDTMWDMRIDSADAYDGAPAADQTGAPQALGNDLTIGGRNLYNTRKFNGSMSEIVIVTPAPTPADAEKLERYLMERWQVEAYEPPGETGDTGLGGPRF